MQTFQHIQTSINESIFRLTLNREEKRNAINEQTMDELLEAIKSITTHKEVVVAVLDATGADFCAGADLDWMRTTQQMTVAQLQQQNMKLQKVFQMWFDLPLFTIAILHGNVVGGGIGLVAASDLVIADPATRFRFSEVSLGLIPATIAPFVLQRTQSQFIRNAMLTAMPFSAEDAAAYQLVDHLIDKPLVHHLLDRYVSSLMKNEPLAIAQCKQLTHDLVCNRVDQPMDVYTTRLLAEVRKSDATSRRIADFFSKQK